VAQSVEKEIQELRSLFWSDRDPDGRAFAALADAHRKAGDFDQALELLTDGLARHPDFATGHVVAGWLHRARGDDVQAESAFRRVMALDPENISALRGLGFLLADRSRAGEALGVFRRLGELEPRDMEVRARIVELTTLADRGGFEPAGPAVPVDTAPPPELSAPAPSAPDIEITPPAPQPVDEFPVETATEPLPGLDESLPGFDEPLPGLDESLPGFDEPTAVAEEPLPGFDEPLPGLDESLPGFDEPAQEGVLGADAFGIPDRGERETQEYVHGDAEMGVVEVSLDGLDLDAPESLEEGPDEGVMDIGALGEDAPSEPVDDVLDIGALGEDAPSDEPQAATAPITRTMGDLYAAQGLFDRAADVYRRLLADSPGDQGLAGRLQEIEALASGGEPPASPAPDAEPPVADYFQSLLTWDSGGPPPEGDDGGADPEDEEFA
jgi:tetratricopeptide (TPR) repeat protein